MVYEMCWEGYLNKMRSCTVLDDKKGRCRAFLDVGALDAKLIINLSRIINATE